MVGTIAVTVGEHGFARDVTNTSRCGCVGCGICGVVAERSHKRVEDRRLTCREEVDCGVVGREADRFRLVIVGALADWSAQRGSELRADGPDRRRRPMRRTCTCAKPRGRARSSVDRLWIPAHLAGGPRSISGRRWVDLARRSLCARARARASTRAAPRWPRRRLQQRVVCATATSSMCPSLGTETQGLPMNVCSPDQALQFPCTHCFAASPPSRAGNSAQDWGGTVLTFEQ
jgi:hypothetical protein